MASALISAPSADTIDDQPRHDDRTSGNNCRPRVAAEALARASLMLALLMNASVLSLKTVAPLPLSSHAPSRTTPTTAALARPARFGRAFLPMPPVGGDAAECRLRQRGSSPVRSVVALFGEVGANQDGTSEAAAVAAGGETVIEELDSIKEAAVADDSSSVEERPMKKKKQKKKKPQQQQPAPVVIDVSKLDIRVGVITKAWVHEEADRLFCEEIDIGEEGGPRQIASGLREHYDVGDLEGQRVLVLANLKSRKLAGFPSHGMVLCAVGDDGSTVKFVEPPEGATVGERVMVDGFGGEPATENQVIKKKMLDKIFPDLKTDGGGVAMYRDVPLSTGAGPCVAQGGIANVPIS